MRHQNLLSAAKIIGIFSLGASLAQAQFYKQTNLVTDLATGAPIHDPNLVNPWGMVYAPGGPWWISDEGTGLSTVYNSSGQIINLVVTVPPASGTGKGHPTGIVYYPELAAFVFVTTDGTVSSWNGGASAVIKVTKHGASYVGATLAVRNQVRLLYVANSAGGIDVYDHNFTAVHLAAGAFKDPRIAAGFTPYNVQAVGNVIYVTYAGPGAGYVDAYDVNGKLLLQFPTGTFLKAPWGVAMAPANFGALSNLLLVGNLGSGKIAAFNPHTGVFRGFMNSAAGKPIVIQDLWGIAFGDGGVAGPKNHLFFTAGIRGYAHGLFGSIAVAP